MEAQSRQLVAGSTATTAVRTIGLTKWIDERPILKKIDLEIASGQYVALLGANGAGKSTMLRLLATLISPSAGRIELFGQAMKRDTSAVRARIGLIAHQSMLYRDLSAFENLVFFGRLYNVANVIERAKQMLKIVGLEDRAHDPVKAFSRGMTQRVSIARALMHDPDLILADEPFAGLDVPSMQGLEKLLANLHERGKTILLVNHDIEQSLRISQRAIVLHGGRVAIDRASWDLDSATVLAEVGCP